MHRHNICHRDLKSANLFLNKEENFIKIGDFNVSMQI